MLAKAGAPAIAGTPAPCNVCALLGLRDALGLHTLLALGRLVGDFGAFLQGLEAGSLYTRVVHEEILTPLVRGDKAVAFLVAEPLNRSLGHIHEPAFLSSGLPQQKAAPHLPGGASIKTIPSFSITPQEYHGYGR